MVSHDRDFLDKVVTSILDFGENGDVTEYAGGYSDMLSQRARLQNQSSQSQVRKIQQGNIGSKRPKKKLSYKETKALETATTDLEHYGQLLDQLEKELDDPSLFESDPENFQAKINQIAEVRQKLETAEEEWLRLETLKEELEGLP